MYQGKAMGLVTEHADWKNPNFDFIVGVAAESWGDPNRQLKPIEQKAKEEGKPFLCLYRWSVDAYTRAQTPLNSWVPVEKDEPLQAVIAAIKNRAPKALVVEIMDATDHDGRGQSPAYFSIAAQRFVGRVADWLRENKPDCRLMLGTSNGFIAAFAPNMNNWAGQYASWIDQPARALVASYPADAEKPSHISTRDTWEMWRYYRDLVIFNGGREQCWAWLGFAGDAPAPEESQPEPEQPAGGDLAAALARLAALEAAHADLARRVVALEAAREHTHGVSLGGPVARA